MSKNDEHDPIPGLVLMFYMFLIYLFFGVMVFAGAGCSGWQFQVGTRRVRDVAHERALPADSQSCQVDYHPWNETCDR